MALHGSRTRLNRCGAIVAGLLMATAGCGTSGGAPETSVVPVPEVNQSASSPTEGKTSSNDSTGSAASDGTATKYFTAIAHSDVDEMTSAKDLVAPKSLADAYLRFQLESTQADVDGGVSDGDGNELEPQDPGKYGYCPEGVEPGSSKCSIWSDVTFADGKVNSFKINDTDISKRISVGNGDKVKVGSLAEVRYIVSYKTVTSKAVTVVFEVKSRKESMTLNLYGATYRSPSGKQSKATGAGGPDDLTDNSSTNAYVSFKGAEPGGTVTLDFYDSDYSDHYVKIKTS